MEMHHFNLKKREMYSVFGPILGENVLIQMYWLLHVHIIEPTV